MKNKNGILMPETLKIVIAVMSIILLVFASSSFAGIFIKSTKLKQVEDSLGKISSAIEKVKNEGGEVEVLLESPKDWGIFTFSSKNIKPIQCEETPCVCICEYETGDFLPEDYSNNCDKKGEGFCKDVSINVVIDKKIEIKGVTSLKIFLSGAEIKIEKNEK